MIENERKKKEEREWIKKEEEKEHLWIMWEQEELNKKYNRTLDK